MPKKPFEVSKEKQEMLFHSVIMTTQDSALSRYITEEATYAAERGQSYTWEGPNGRFDIDLRNGMSLKASWQTGDTMAVAALVGLNPVSKSLPDLGDICEVHYTWAGVSSYTIAEFMGQTRGGDGIWQHEQIVDGCRTAIQGVTHWKRTEKRSQTTGLPPSAYEVYQEDGL